ncbi:unnamed protein product [Meloidogyne enterolobii]|uniref:Uncharacterized protein n=1 Tax=Meloidogyne enterolobii TaxID=390850 RepID=A0ACB1ARP9_MELEN
MKLSTCFIFLFLICILFDLNYCRKSNKNKRGKNGKNQKTPKCETLMCKNFCKRGITAGGIEKIKQTRGGNKVKDIYCLKVHMYLIEIEIFEKPGPVPGRWS